MKSCRSTSLNQACSSVTFAISFSARSKGMAETDYILPLVRLSVCVPAHTLPECQFRTSCPTCYTWSCSFYFGFRVRGFCLYFIGVSKRNSLGVKHCRWSWEKTPGQFVSAFIWFAQQQFGNWKGEAHLWVVWCFQFKSAADFIIPPATEKFSFSGNS